VKHAIENDKPVPHEYKNLKENAIKEMTMADDHTIARRTHVDDEYEQARYRDPKLLVTTSREPS
jgi:hypothetical protein